MNIRVDINIPQQKFGNMLAWVKIHTFGDIPLILNGFKLLSGKGGQPWLAWPSQPTKQTDPNTGKPKYLALTWCADDNTRKMIEQQVIQAYQMKLSQPQPQPQGQYQPQPQPQPQPQQIAYQQPQQAPAYGAPQQTQTQMPQPAPAGGGYAPQQAPPAPPQAPVPQQGEAPNMAPEIPGQPGEELFQ